MKRSYQVHNKTSHKWNSSTDTQPFEHFGKTREFKDFLKNSWMHSWKNVKTNQLYHSKRFRSCFVMFDKSYFKNCIKCSIYRVFKKLFKNIRYI